jgi:hypothetical protein
VIVAALFKCSRDFRDLLQVKMYWQCAKGLALFRPHPSTRVAANSLDSQNFPGKSAVSELGLECAKAPKQAMAGDSRKI